MTAASGTGDRWQTFHQPSFLGKVVSGVSTQKLCLISRLSTIYDGNAQADALSTNLLIDQILPVVVSMPGSAPAPSPIQAASVRLFHWRNKVMEKIEKDGRVAVLYSPGFGAGWSTWAEEDQREALCMDARIVGPFLAGDRVGAIDAALAMFPNLYTGGARDLSVEWVEKGKAFEVEEYDGSETVHVIGDRKYLIA